MVVFLFMLLNLGGSLLFSILTILVLFILIMIIIGCGIVVVISLGSVLFAIVLYIVIINYSVPALQI